MAEEEHRPIDRDKETTASPPELPDEAFVPPKTAPMPKTIGHYRIIRAIGEGGMGIVYEAEQEAPRRMVALTTITHEAPAGP
jgi:serine/threonine protein kinase